MNDDNNDTVNAIKYEERKHNIKIKILNVFQKILTKEMIQKIQFEPVMCNPFPKTY